MAEELNSNRQTFVELNRRFRKLEPKAKVEDAAFESYTAHLYGRDTGFGWDDLLKHSRVIILGEPGSGKSWELRKRSKLLTDKGAIAFFVRLDQLIDCDLNGLFGANERNLFIRWRRSSEVAYFFLDSVDEAKFRKVSDFHAVLRKLCNEIGADRFSRTKIFLSSRISEWKPLTDAFEFQRLFPSFPVEERTREAQTTEFRNADAGLLTVQLEPLQQGQVETLARANGIPDVEAFSQALDQAFAWEFARRPLDVLDLVGFWKENKRVGSLTELIEFDIVSKLRPREGRDEFPLSEAEGREGVEWLAAATFFSRRFSFGVLDVRIPTDFGQRSDFSRTVIRFISDAVPI